MSDDDVFENDDRLRALGLVALDTSASRGLTIDDAVEVTTIDGTAYLANGGILDPRFRLLRAGSVIWRFGNMNLTRKGALGPSAGYGIPNWAVGHWWIDADAFAKIHRHAMTHGCSLSQAASDLCVIPPSFSNRAMYGSFRLTADVPALSGVGRAAKGRTEQGGAVLMTPAQGTGIVQIYIPLKYLGTLTPLRQFASVASAGSLLGRTGQARSD